MAANQLYNLQIDLLQISIIKDMASYLHLNLSKSFLMLLIMAKRSYNLNKKLQTKINCFRLFKKLGKLLWKLILDIYNYHNGNHPF